MAYLNDTINYKNGSQNDNYSYDYDYYLDQYYGDYLSFPPRKTFGNVTMGIIHLFLSLFFMILQILVFTSFYNNRELFNKSCFRIIFNHGIVSFIQQICHTITSIILIFWIRNILLVLSLIGSLLTATYLGSIVFIFLLTLNRFDIIYGLKFLHEYQNGIIYTIGIIICYILTVTIFVVCLILPQFKKVFSFNSFEWIYYDIVFSRETYKFEKYYTYTFLGGSLILQFLILLKIISIRCYTSKKGIFVVDDLKIIFHALLCFVLALLLQLSRDGILFEIYESKYLTILPHIIYIFCSVSNSLFVLCFVKDIRKNTNISKYFLKKNTIIVPSKFFKSCANTHSAKTI